MAGVVFQTDPELSFVAGLARWIDGKLEPAPAAEEAAEGAPAQEPTPFEAECVKLEEAKSYGPLSEKLSAGLKGRFGSSSEAEVASAYAIYLQLLVRWGLLAKRVEGIADELSASTDERPQLRRSLLVSLYSLVQQFGLVELRFAVLLRVVRYASATAQLDLVFGAASERAETVERWTQQWELSAAQKSELWGLFFDAHADDPSTVHTFALKYLGLHDGSALASDATLHARLVKALLTTIRNPGQFQYDELASLGVVKQLESDAKLAPLYRLLTILARDTVAEYAAFRGEQGAFLQSHGLEDGALTKKMRLLSIVSLGAAEKELSYAAIAAALKVDVAEVETWVMEAIGAGLLTAKMDQVGGVVAVSYVAEREFGAQQWKKLHASLGDWRDSIRGMLTVIQNSRPAASS